MQLPNNWQPIINKPNFLAYNEYLLYNQLLDFLPYTDMEWMV